MVIIYILVLLIVKIKVKTIGHYDVFQNSGHFDVRLYNFTVYKADLHLESNDIKHNNIIIEHNKKKNEIHLNANKKDKQSIVSIVTQPLAQSIMIESIDLRLFFGKDNDAFMTTLLLCGIKVALCSALAYIKNHFNARVRETFEPVYNADKFRAQFYLEVSITLADVIRALVLMARNFITNKIKGGKKLDSRTKRASD